MLVLGQVMKSDSLDLKQPIKEARKGFFVFLRQFFYAGFISVSRDFTPYFHFRCVARAAFDRDLIHSADACFLVMACVGYSRAQLKTLSITKKHASAD